MSGLNSPVPITLPTPGPATSNSQTESEENPEPDPDPPMNTVPELSEEEKRAIRDERYYTRMVAAIGPGSTRPDTSGYTLDTGSYPGGDVSKDQLYQHVFEGGKRRRANEDHSWFIDSYNDKHRYNQRKSGLRSCRNPADTNCSPGLPTDDYVRFGYWSQYHARKAGKDFKMNPFYEVAIRYKNDDLSHATDGKLSYSGSSVGMFALNKDDKHYSGKFRAEVDLTLSISGLSVSPQGSISGSVSKFHDMEGDAPIGDWEVELPNANVGQTSDSRLDSFEGSSEDGAVNWKGIFGGPVPGGRHATKLPTGVAGEFDARMEDGIVRGAFGARDY